MVTAVCYTFKMIDIGKVASKLKPKVGKVAFIAIDGHSGSGKSTLAKWLAEIIHTDDFASWENPLNWWSDVIEKVFKPIQEGAASLSYQPTSWWENHHPEPIENQPVTAIMILEGVSSSRREFDDYISYRIFVDTPKEVCLERGLQRDASTGKSVEELTKMWEAWFQKEMDYMERDNPKEKADIIIDGTKDLEEQIQ
jgi:uridine kinase